jgi:hypothetical protein
MDAIMLRALPVKNASELVTPYLDWQTPSFKILAFNTAKVARISELI